MWRESFERSPANMGLSQSALLQHLAEMREERIGRGSPRSIMATLAFMMTAIAISTVFVAGNIIGV